MEGICLRKGLSKRKNIFNTKFKSESVVETYQWIHSVGSNGVI